MLYHILKNIWASRRRNMWIFIELILVSILAWAIIDPLFVIHYNQSIPTGFSVDNVYKMELNSLPSSAPGYQKERRDSASWREDFNNILLKLKTQEDIQAVTFLFDNQYPYSTSHNFETMSVENDSTVILIDILYTLDNSDFFEVFQLHPVGGGTWQDLAEVPLEPGTMMLSDNMNQAINNENINLVGRNLVNVHAIDVFASTSKVVALFQPLKLYSYMQPIVVGVRSVQLPTSQHNITCFFRVKEGISETAFLEKFRPWMSQELRSGNLYMSELVPYHHLKENLEMDDGVTNDIIKKYAFASFFLINLLLGVAGTFWLNTRVRKEEIGIRLSFGATPQAIQRMMLGEGLILTTIATLIGCFVYLQWALKEGLFSYEIKLFDKMISFVDPVYIINHFAPHFILVSLVVYFLLLIVVSLGIWLPARAASKINPVDALRDE